MCGIAGYLVAEARGATPVMAMAAAIAHRGPDDEGFVLADLPGRQQHTYASAKSPHAIRHAYPVLQGDDSVPMHNLAMAQVRYSIIDLHSPWPPTHVECLRALLHYLQRRDL